MSGNSASTRLNIVIGGGILGLLTSWYLTEAGESVVLFDRQEVGKESSWAGGGILSPLYPNRYPALRPLVNSSRHEYRLITDKLQESTGIDSEFRLTELLVLNDPAGDGPQICRRIGRAELGEIEPNLAVRTTTTAFVYPAAQVRNPHLLKALKSALSKKGVVLCEHKEIRHFLVDEGRFAGVMASGKTTMGARCFVTAGAWSATLMEQLGFQLPIRPIKGQMITFAATVGLVSRVIVRDYRYLIPRLDGLVLVGSTLEDAGFSKDITAAARSDLYQVAINIVPALAEFPIAHHWAGLRPGSPDDMPFIGEHPLIKGLFVCAGHHRNGFASGPASAKLVVDMALGRNLSVDPTPFRLDRVCPKWHS